MHHGSSELTVQRELRVVEQYGHDYVKKIKSLCCMQLFEARSRQSSIGDNSKELNRFLDLSGHFKCRVVAKDD
jgi:hypothetical protein